MIQKSNPIKNASWLDFLDLGILIGILFFLIQKALIAAITHDEAYTWNVYVTYNYLDILAYKDPFTNNHILNTLLIKFFTSVFGVSKITIRLPNIISFIGYSWFVFHIIKSHDLPRWLKTILFILFLANPFLLDFFSIARGYGIAICLIMGSCYWYRCFLTSQRQLHLLLATTFGVLAMLANFATAYFLFCLLLFHSIYGFIVWKQRNSLKPLVAFYIRDWFYYLLITLPVFIIILYEPLRRFRGAVLNFGGVTGFWSDTVLSLIDSSLYGWSSNFYDTVFKTVYILFILAIVISSFISIIEIVKRGKSGNAMGIRLLFSASIIYGIFIANKMANWSMGTPFMMDRFALFLVPLFLLHITDIFTFLYSKNRFLHTILVLIVISMTIHTVKKFNYIYYSTWKYDSDAEALMQFIIQKRDRKINCIEISWVFEPSLNFYRKFYQLKELQPFNRNGLTGNCEYAFISFYDYERLPNRSAYEVIETFSRSENVLLKKLP